MSQMNSEKKFKILAADDEKANLDVLIHVLRDLYTVYPAKTGEACLKKAAEINPDLILLDIILPDMNGFDILQHLKSDDLTEHIPVMLLTAFNNAEDEKRGLQLGAVDCISKPFNDEMVKVRVNTQLELIRHIRALEDLKIYDDETGLPNRKTFDSQLTLEWARAIRNKTPISLIMLDIDGYEDAEKNHNKEYSLQLLRSASEVINKRLKRQTDVKARYRGTVFAVILPNTPLEGAKIVARDIKEGTRGLIKPGGENITLSIGVSTMTPAKDEPVSYFVLQADRNLYKAKIEGDTICY